MRGFEDGMALELPGRYIDCLTDNPQQTTPNMTTFLYDLNSGNHFTISPPFCFPL